MILDEAQITETEDMVELIPGIIQSPGVGSGTNMGIRGMIQFTVGANSTAAVQAHINGMQINQSVFTTIGFFDVRKIDILKVLKVLYLEEMLLVVLLTLLQHLQSITLMVQ